MRAWNKKIHRLSLFHFEIHPLSVCEPGPIKRLEIIAIPGDTRLRTILCFHILDKLDLDVMSWEESPDTWDVFHTQSMDDIREQLKVMIEQFGSCIFT